MAEERIVISSLPSVNPEELTSRTFSSVFRGYDPTEVRSFLKRVSDEMVAAAQRESELRRSLQEALARAAHPELDEQTVTAALGEHAARLLVSAKEAAAGIRGEAESQVSARRRQADEDVARIRGEAESLLARRMQEADLAAEEVRGEAEAAARSLREKAKMDSEAEVAAAQTRGREMVAEARALRERMLSDLARRRRLAQGQIDQLRAARDRLAASFEVVRRTLEEATQELRLSESEARSAAESVARRARTDKVPSAADLEAELEASEAAVQAEAQAQAAHVSSEPATESATLEPLRPDPHGPAAAPTDFTPVPETEIVSGATEPEAGSLDPADHAISTGGSEPRGDFEVPLPATVAEPVPEHRGVDDLFARLRAGEDSPSLDPPLEPAFMVPPDEAPGEAPGEDAAAPGDEDLATATEPPAGDDAILFRRDESLDHIEADLVRSLKRLLQDEQNEVLDSVRSRGRASPEVGLPEVADQIERYQEVAMGPLGEAVGAGVSFSSSVDEPTVANGSSNGDGVAIHSGVDVVRMCASDLAMELVVPLRDRLETSFREATQDGDLDDDGVLLERVSACYRQCKTTHLEEVVRHHAAAAFSRGAFDAFAVGTLVRWVVDDDGPCPDCDDNALAGANTKGTPFPTGQPCPPAHPGCRCVLVRAAGS